MSGAVRCDLTRPANGDRFTEGEVGKRIYRATVGMPAHCVLQLAVSERTPTHDVRIPDGMRIQITAPDAATLRNWLTVVSAGVMS
ncbi:hypothetical protein [Microbacterium awajiense]|uniref:hypothetical protein n=1 Tax=Microbacterium awajiense TaxID=415214 RepID=UPI0031DF4A03